MKAIEIKKETTRIIAEHIASGWTLDWNNSTGSGARTIQFFTRDGQLRCLAVKEVNGCGLELDRLEVHLFNVSDWRSGPYGGFDWNSEDEDGIATTTYWKVDDDWFVEDEAEAILAKKHERVKRGFDPYRQELSLEPTEALVEAMRRVPGFEKAESKNLRVTKTTQQLLWHSVKCGYKVELMSRQGNVKASRFYPLG